MSSDPPSDHPRKRAYVQAYLMGSDTLDVTSKDATYRLTKDMVKCFFDLPSIDAARELRVCLTVLKKIRKWAGLSRWPFAHVNLGIFEMKREEIVALRRGIIAGLEQGEAARYPGVLPLLKRAEMLGLAFKVISTPTMYALEDRAKTLASKESKDKQRPVERALAARVVTDVFKRPIVRQREKWVSKAAVCLSDAVPVSLSDGALKEPEPEQALSRLAIDPLSYVRECAVPPWAEPAYPPAAEIADGVGALWPVMEDPRRIWMQELICRSLVPSRSGPGISVGDLLASAPVSASEMRFVDGFLEDLSD